MKINVERLNPGLPLLLLLGLAFLVLTGWAVQQAVSRVSAVTDAGYYSLGRRYHHSQLEQRAAASLDWQLATNLENGGLQLRLTAHGVPVTGGTGEVQLGAHGRAGVLTLREEAPGLYVVSLPPEAAGTVSARVLLTRDGARISRALLLHF